MESGARESLGHAELLDAIEAVDEAVAIFDDQGSVLSMNGAARRLHGCPEAGCGRMRREEYAARYEARDPSGQPVQAADRPLARALRGEAVRGVELWIRDRDTGRAWVGLHAAVPIVSSEGRRLVTVTIRDITERRQAFEALREADRRKDEFLAVLSHELRNPLAPIRSAVYLLDRAEPASDGARRAREVIARQVDHLSRMVEDLLDVSRIARGRIELHPARVDLADLVRRAGEDHRGLLASRGLELQVEAEGGPLPVDGDPTRLAQLLGNLLQNSAKYTPRGGTVTLSAAGAGGHAEVRVRDNGVGILPDLLGRVFEPFVQDERTLARSRGGLGLGLPLVKGLAELHGGTVEARSAGRGAGTEMVVRIPLADGAAADAGGDPGPAATSAGRRVLVVDDNVDAATSLSDLVELFGHRAEVVHDGRAAVEAARAQHPDVVLCDLGLPGMDGYEVARAIRSEPSLADVRLVAVSGYAQPEDRARAARAGFDEHVAKPADPAVIGRLLS